MTPIRVVYRKYDGSLHWNYATHRLGEDEHGVWVGAPAGTVVQQRAEPFDAAYHAWLARVA
jgi:hypothetical protein